MFIILSINACIHTEQGESLVHLFIVTINLPITAISHHFHKTRVFFAEEIHPGNDNNKYIKRLKFPLRIRETRGLPNIILSHIQNRILYRASIDREYGIGW